MRLTRLKRLSWVLAFAGMTVMLMTAPTSAHSYTHNGIQIGHAWALQSAGTQSLACLPLNNTNALPDRLIKAVSMIAQISFVSATGTTQKTIDLLPNKPVPMRADGLHLELTGLKHPIKAGDHIPATLIFEKAGPVKIELYVEVKPDMAMHKGM